MIPLSYNRVDMSKIVMIAQGQHIARYGLELKNQLSDPEEFDIYIAHMEDAVRLAKRLCVESVDVFIARGSTADLLRAADLNTPIVDIMLGNTEVIASIKEARALFPGKSPHIGILGFNPIYSSVKSFLDLLNIQVRLYPIGTMQETVGQIENAKSDGVDVLICGALSYDLIRNVGGIKGILLESSFEAVSEAFRRAKEVQRAVSIEKKKIERTNTIFNSVSDAIVSTDGEGLLTFLNKNAELLFEKESSAVFGRPMRDVLRESECALVREVLITGEEVIGGIFERRGRKYAIRIVPIIVTQQAEGVVITLQEIHLLQKMETTVRKGLYAKGNIANYTFDDIKGGSEEIRDTVETARSFAKLQSNVLIFGDTGTGKELFAQSIHNASIRREGPFVAVNCGAIPSTLMDSELFGYVDGSFTGARKGGKIGLFEMAHGGTIFLDEISEMDPQGQVILLRALQERQIRRVGGDTNIPIDVRVIAACNVNLNEKVSENRFRKDLYYRLSVLVLKIPPLKDRRGDIARLASQFIDTYNAQFGKQAVLSAAAVRELETFDWDGNIRQLKNFCERIVAVAEESVMSGAFIGRQLENSCWLDERLPSKREILPLPKSQNSEGFISIKGKVFAREQIRAIFIKNKRNREVTARELGISRTTLWKHLKVLGESW